MSEADCIFCKIVRGETETEEVDDEEEVRVVEAVRRRAPVHVRVIPKQHVASLDEIARMPEPVARRLFEVSSMVAEKLGVRESGYAIRINNGPDAGQEVFHLHLHLLGGQRIGMP